MNVEIVELRPYLAKLEGSMDSILGLPLELTLSLIKDVLTGTSYSLKDFVPLRTLQAMGFEGTTEEQQQHKERFIQSLFLKLN